MFYSGFIGSLGNTATFSAFPMSATIASAIDRVFLRKLVTALALCLTGSIGHKRVSSHDVFTVSNRFQMIGVYALAVAAQVIEFQSYWYWSLRQFIGNSVGQFQTIWHPEYPVSGFLNVAGPLPTSRLCNADLSIEPFSGSYQHGYNPITVRITT